MRMHAGERNGSLQGFLESAWDAKDRGISRALERGNIASTGTSPCKAPELLRHGRSLCLQNFPHEGDCPCRKRASALANPHGYEYWDPAYSDVAFSYAYPDPYCLVSYTNGWGYSARLSKYNTHQ
jgi:hypothetical protein